MRCEAHRWSILPKPKRRNGPGRIDHGAPRRSHGARAASTTHQRRPKRRQWSGPLLPHLAAELAESEAERDARRACKLTTTREHRTTEHRTTEHGERAPRSEARSTAEHGAPSTTEHGERKLTPNTTTGTAPESASSRRTHARITASLRRERTPSGPNGHALAVPRGTGQAIPPHSARSGARCRPIASPHLLPDDQLKKSEGNAAHPL